MKVNDNSSEYFKLKKKNLYQGANMIGSVGVWYTIISFIGIIIFLSVFLIIVNFVYHYKWKITQAELVEAPNCYTHIHYNDDTKYKTIKCDYTVNYEIDNKKYSGQLIQKESLNIIHNEGKKFINIEYNPENPNEIDTIFPKKIINIILSTLLTCFIIVTIFLIIYRDNNVVKTLSTINMVKDIIKKK